MLITYFLTSFTQINRGILTGIRLRLFAHIYLSMIGYSGWMMMRDLYHLNQYLAFLILMHNCYMPMT